MSNRTRAFRRHHRQRMIAHAYRKYQDWWWFDNEELTKIYSVKNHNHLAACSCQMCRNPRHCGWLSNKEKLTLQERKVYNSKSEGLDDYYSDPD